MSKRRELSAALLGITVALILWLTILSRDAQAIGVPFYPPFHTFGAIWKNIQRGGLSGNFLGNIILFIPVGALLSIVTQRAKAWRTLTIGFAFSLLIETAQLITSRGCFDPDDVMLNCLGCLIGYGLMNSGLIHARQCEGGQDRR